MNGPANVKALGWDGQSGASLSINRDQLQTHKICRAPGAGLDAECGPGDRGWGGRQQHPWRWRDRQASGKNSALPHPGVGLTSHGTPACKVVVQSLGHDECSASDPLGFVGYSVIFWAGFLYSFPSILTVVLDLGRGGWDDTDNSVPSMLVLIISSRKSLCPWIGSPLLL